MKRGTVSMKKARLQQLNEELEKMDIPAFGYEMIREKLIPDLLGKEFKSILYWAGRNLARHYPLSSTEEIIAFFPKAGFGNLSVVKESKDNIEFLLKGPLIENRFNRNEDATYSLESGFLAEQVEKIVQYSAEAVEEQRKRALEIHIIVQWDKRDPKS
jgi:predicted hydrocarbon binding protein